MKTVGETAPRESLRAEVTPEHQRAELDKILRSEAFRSAPGLQRFLEFVSRKAIEGLGQDIKEYTLGIEVFGRSAEFDPKIDTVVRVQAHRLREKLTEYYATEGARDSILLTIPKGHYVPHFSWRLGNGNQFEPLGLQAAPGETAAGARQGVTLDESSRRLKAKALIWPSIAAGIVWLAVLGVTALRDWRATNGRDLTRSETTAPAADGPLRELWADYLKPESSPMVAFSNAVFLVTETSDLLRLKNEEVDNMGAPAGRDLAKRLAVNPRLLDSAGPVFFEDVYTGTGEVLSVFYLTRMFAQFGSSFGVKRIRLVTTDDLTRHDLVFLGSTREDALLAGLPLTQDFVFAWPPKLTGVWSGRIVNLHPRAGEAPWYGVELDPKSHVLRADYALVSFLPGMASNRKVAVLGGLTTFGTQAAAEFATSPTAIAELASWLATHEPQRSPHMPPYFQAVLLVQIVKGDVLSTKLVAAHALQVGRP